MSTLGSESWAAILQDAHWGGYSKWCSCAWAKSSPTASNQPFFGQHMQSHALLAVADTIWSVWQGAHGSTFLYCFFVRSFPAKSASFWKFCPFPKFRSWDQNPPDWGDCLGLLIVPQATQSILVFHWPTIVCVLSRLVLCLFSCSAWYYRRHELCFRVNRFCVDDGQTLRRPHPSGASGGQEMRTRMSCAYVYNIYIYI